MHPKPYCVAQGVDTETLLYIDRLARLKKRDDERSKGPKKKGKPGKPDGYGAPRMTRCSPGGPDPRGPYTGAAPNPRTGGRGRPAHVIDVRSAHYAPTPQPVATPQWPTPAVRVIPIGG